MTRLIDADLLCEEFKKRHRAALRWKEQAILDNDEEKIIRADATLAFLSEVKLTIDNAPTVEERLLGERVDGEPKGKCKNCKAYRQYGSRADGYCDISRMTPEGMSHINVNEDFYCSYFEEADNEAFDC